MNRSDKETLKMLKDIINKSESLNDLIDLMPFFSQEVNRAYFRSKNPNFERPPLSFSIREGDKLLIQDNKIKVSSLVYYHYHLYKKENRFYAHKILQKEINGDIKPWPCLLKEFDFLGTIICACEVFNPLHELNHWKSKEEVIRGLSNIKLSKESRFLGNIYFNEKGDSVKELPFPTKIISCSGRESQRIDLNDEDFSYSGAGLINIKPKDKKKWTKREKSYIHHEYNVSSKPINDSYADGFKPNNNYDWENIVSFDYYLKGNPEKIKRDKEFMDAECDGFYEARQVKEELIKDLKKKGKL